MYSTVQWFVSVLEKQHRDKAARCGALPWRNPPRGPQEMQHSLGQAVPGCVQTGACSSPLPYLMKQGKKSHILSALKLDLLHLQVSSYAREPHIREGTDLAQSQAFLWRAHGTRAAWQAKDV